MAKNNANFSGNISKNQQRILQYANQIKDSEEKSKKYGDDIVDIKDEIKKTDEEINELLKKGNNITKEELKNLTELQSKREKQKKDLENNEQGYKRVNEQIEKTQSKLEQLEKVTENLINGTSEYDSTLRSIGSQYGEINSVYKESEKILEQNKNEISGIISITGLLNSSNKDLVNGILQAQSGYRGITNEVVKNIGSLEDSESAFKKISYEIESQKKLIGGLSAELDKIDTSDETQLELAKDLKIQLNAQVDSLDKMKDAAAGVSKEMQRLNYAAGEISSTMFGGWVDQFLKITKVLGITNFGSIAEAFESIGKSDAQKTLKNLQGVKDIEIKAPDEKTAQNLTEVKDTQIKAPDQKTVENLTEVKDAEIAAQKGKPTESIITGGPIEQQQTQGIQSIGQSMQKVAKNTTPPKQKATVARLESVGTKRREKQEAKDLSLDIKSEGGKQQAEQLAKAVSGTAPLSGETTNVEGSMQAQELAELNKNTKEAEVSGNKIGNKQTNVAGAAASTAGAVGTAAGAAAAGGALATAATGVGVVIAAGMLTKEIAEYEDSMESVAFKYNNFGALVSASTKEVLKQLIDLKDVSEVSKDVQNSIKDTEEYRKLLFEYGAKAQMRERQNLESDYFNYNKSVYFDYFNYQQSIVKDQLEYRIGLERDALNFQFQQQSANLDAELEKRKTLAGSALGFIKDYSKISERALNAIGSSTKAIMDGMKKFGAVLETTPKQLFSLLENAQGLAYSLGTSADEVMNIGHLFKLTSNTSEEVGQGLVEGLKKLEGKNATSVFNEIAEASADIYRLMSATPNEIYKQTAALQKAGVKLSTMLKASDTMVLNYKDSIKAEMSLGAMMGRNISFNEARARLMANDMAGAANVIREQLAGVDVNQLNPFEKQDLARATGLSMDQILEITQGKEIKTDEQKQLEQAEKTGAAIAKGVLNQDIANAGARLALEQKQRKEMLEFEQRMRLLNLRIEQKQRLEQIPIESKFRMYYDMVYGKKQAEEGMYYDVVEGIATATRRTYGRDGLGDLEESYNQSLQIMGISQVPTNVGGSGLFGGQNMQGGSGLFGGQNMQGGTNQFILTFPTGNQTGGQNIYNQPQIEVLGKTIVELDNTLNEIGVKSTDSRYVDWLMDSGDIGNKFKTGKIDATKAEQEYRDTFNKYFAVQADVFKQAQQQQKDFAIKTIEKLIQDTDFGKKIDQIIDPGEYRKTLEKYADGIDEGWAWFENDVIVGGETFDPTGYAKNSEERKKMYDAYNTKLKKYLTDLNTQFANDLISREQYEKKLQEVINDFGLTLPKIQPEGINEPPDVSSEPFIGLPNFGDFMTSPTVKDKVAAAELNRLNKGQKNILNAGYSPYKYPFLNQPNNLTDVDINLLKKSPGSPTATYDQMKTRRENANKKPVVDDKNIELKVEAGSTPTTKVETATKPKVETATKPKVEDNQTKPEVKQDVTNVEVNKILKDIEKDAHLRGISLYTQALNQNTNLGKLNVSTDKTVSASELVKTDIKKIKEETVIPIKNQAFLTNELLQAIQEQTDVLALINNNTKGESGFVINLDGAKISNNVAKRSADKKAFNASNRIDYTV
jgi:uncharacterized protein YoxC